VPLLRFRIELGQSVADRRVQNHPVTEHWQIDIGGEPFRNLGHRQMGVVGRPQFHQARGQGFAAECLLDDSVAFGAGLVINAVEAGLIARSSLEAAICATCWSLCVRAFLA
jgi:hypothetical protein